jgi:CHAT domain-containing protein/tetratricopeptide (TPR) repeat protein
LLRNLITNGMTESAIELATRLIDDALQAKDFVAAFSIGGSSIEELNRASAWNEAAAVAGLLTDKFTDDYVAKQLSQAGGGLTSSFWNEAGNTLRYLHYYEQALSAYHISRNFLPLVKDKDDREAREGIVAVNEGRVYRDLRQYGPALQRLTDRVRAHPEDAEAHHGLAILYVDINRFADAAREVDAAIAATDRVVEPRRHANLLITRAVIRMRTGLTQEGAADLNQADNLVPADAEVVHLQIASAAAMLLSKTDSHSDLIERAENRLWAAIRRGSVRNLPIVLATALCALGTLLIEGNRLDDLRRLDRDYLGPVLRDRDAEEWPWQLLYLKARIERALNGDEASWPWLRAALDRVDADTPADGEVGVSVTWLADKDDFQAEITQLAVDLVNRQAVDASELLRVYEFANGRALGVRLARRAVAGDFEATIPKRLAAMAKEREREIVIFLFIDTNEAIHVIQLSSSDPTPRLIPEVSVSAERTRIIGRQFMSAIARANPVALDHLDRDLQPWWSFAGELGTLLVGRLVPDCEVYFLPGRGMAALPLHLLPLGNGRLLIERHSVVFAPNLALLFDERLVNDQDGNNGRLVVSVTKTNDTAEFRNRIDEASRRLLASCETTSRPALHLDGIEAAKKTVIDALAHCDEAFFLCHGTHGGRIKGYGICLADGLQLPPPLLAVDDAPDYARFVLGWDDLDELAAAPALVVSVACSTGRIVLASGGIRLGLEQTLFSRGTRTIVSPMWDVDQVASLAWINSFEAARQASSTKTLADAYRTACLETKKVYSHPFFWAPFVITGPLD